MSMRDLSGFWCVLQFLSHSSNIFSKDVFHFLGQLGLFQFFPLPNCVWDCCPDLVSQPVSYWYVERLLVFMQVLFLETLLKAFINSMNLLVDIQGLMCRTIHIFLLFPPISLIQLRLETQTQLVWILWPSVDLMDML